MFQISWKKAAACAGVASALMLGACASNDDVEKAQATADQALREAQAAGQRADAANQRAAAATQAAQAANDRADRMYQQNLKK